MMRAGEWRGGQFLDSDPRITRLLRSLLVATAFALSAAGLAACEYVGGLDKRFVNPTLYETPEGCVFSDNGSAAIRFVNAVASFERVDLCAKSRTDAAWSGRPITRGLGKECPVGVGYKQVTAPRALPSDTVDLKVIPASAPDCSAEGLSTVSDVALADGTTTVVYAENGHDSVLLAKREGEPNSTSSLVRFVHAVSGLPPVDVYLADSNAWPYGGALAVPALGFGETPEEGGFSEVTDLGYIDFYLSGTEQTFGIRLHEESDGGPSEDGGSGPDEGDATWVAVVGREWLTQVAYSVFAVGRVGDPEFPPELVACLESEDDGFWTSCEGAPAYDLSLTVLHATLSGADYAFDRLRAEQMGAVLAGTDTDVMCLGFVMSDQHKAAIESACHGAGFNVVWPEMNLDTDFDDPRAYDASIPGPPSHAPCDGAVSMQVMTEIMDCIAEYCEGPEGGVENARCLTKHCSVPLFKALTMEEDQKRCAMCLVFSMLDRSPLDRVSSLCGTKIEAGMAFEGKAGTVLLSRLPIRDVEHRAFPSWVWRASATRATIELPNDKDVDVYCTQLSTPERPSTMPYLGRYGDGPLEVKNKKDETKRWTNQTLLQAAQLLEFVRQRSGPRPAVVIGALESGVACPECDPKLQPFGPEVLTSLNETLGLGTARSFSTTCLECGDNPLRPLTGRSEISLWTDHIMLNGIARTDVVDTTRLFENPVLTIPVDGGTADVPLSHHYGLRSVIRFR